ncbi:MAG: alpha/beta hydrolase [Helcococcus sp.]|nr:alpha/beta hydrolase [Helcococcus sp.]
MKQKTKKIILSIFLAVIILITIGLFAGSNYLFNYGLSRGGDGGNRVAANEVIDDESSDSDEISIVDMNKEIIKSSTSSFKEMNPSEIYRVVTNDGLSLFSKVHFNDSDNWVILIHGYRADNENMYDFAPFYYEKGFNVLLPDLRASGSSEGEYIGMGTLDMEDMKLWIDWIIENNSNANIVIHGVSMGAATTMNLSGENLQGNIKVFIEDSGYTSAWNIFKGELKYRFNFPSFPLLNIANIITNMRADYDLKSPSPIEQVAKSDRPIMFIHSRDDDFIPFEMVEELYEAKVNGDREIIRTDIAGHGDVMYYLNDEYWNQVFEFIGKYIDIN